MSPSDEETLLEVLATELDAGVLLGAIDDAGTLLDATDDAGTLLGAIDDAGTLEDVTT
jgi:hypothetical protein